MHKLKFKYELKLCKFATETSNKKFTPILLSLHHCKCVLGHSAECGTLETAPFLILGQKIQRYHNYFIS